MYDGTVSTRPNYSSQGPTYTSYDTYDVIDFRQQEADASPPRPPNHSLVKDEASKKEDDFYDAEEHTYSVVIKSNKMPSQQENHLCTTWQQLL